LTIQDSKRIEPKLLTEQLISFLVNNLLWGNFEIKEEAYAMFGCSTFFIEMGEYYLFASINLERYPIINHNGTVSIEALILLENYRSKIQARNKNSESIP